MDYGASNTSFSPMQAAPKAGGSFHHAHHQPPALNTRYQLHAPLIGIYGWRKRFLYLLLLLLIITVTINIGLTVWILRVMDFNFHGMGKLRILDNGIKVDGDATFLKSLSAQKIKSLNASGLNIVSNKNITISCRDKENSPFTSKVYIGDKQFVVYAKRFQIQDTLGKQLFTASDDSVALGADTLDIAGSKGIQLQKDVKTPILRNYLNTDLRLVSKSRGVYVYAAEDISIRSLVGDVNVISSSNINLQSLNQAISLEAPNITLRGLPVIAGVKSGHDVFSLVYQLCVCGNNGKLFLSEPQGNCIATHQICS